MTTPTETRRRPSSPIALAAQVVGLAAVIALGTLAAQGYGPVLLDLAVWGAEELYYGALRQVTAIENLLANAT